MAKKDKLGVVITDGIYDPNEAVEVIDYTDAPIPKSEGISVEALNNARKVVGDNLGITAPKMKEKEATEGITKEVTPATIPTPTVDPYAKTKAAQEAAQKAFSEQLVGMFKEREKAREKRKRTAEKVAIGHALGDLFGAIGAHYAATKNNTGAVVAQPLSPKSYEKIQALIDEDVADKNTFDQYMLSLTQKKGEQDVAMAMAEDKLAIDQANAALKAAIERGDKEAERALKIYLAQLNAGVKQTEIDARAAEGEKERQNDIDVAKIRSEVSASSKDKGKDTLANWQRRAGEKLVRKTTTTTSSSTNELTGSTDIRESKSEHSPNETEMRNAYAQAEALASKWGIELSENTIQDFEDLYDLIGKKSKSGVEVTADLITKARNAGHSIKDIKNYLK